MFTVMYSNLWDSLTCDYLGRKMAIVFTTVMIVVGGILATASHGVTIDGMFWMMTVARGIVGFGIFLQVRFLSKLEH
jgi:Sugar (and other) transporter.